MLSVCCLKVGEIVVVRGTGWKRGVRWAALVLVLAVPQRAEAIPASPHPFEVVQPDGTSITLHIRGDEYFHWYEDLNGYTVVLDRGTYVYAQLSAEDTLVPTKLVVGVDDPGAGAAGDGVGTVHRYLPATEKGQVQVIGHSISQCHRASV